MKIYTKSGDKGKTSLVTGTRVKKYHIRLEAYGMIDELNSYIGLLVSFEINTRNKNFLLAIQHKLFNIGSILATDEKEIQFELPKLKASDTESIEKEIDFLNEQIPPLKNFILPGGNQLIAHCHIARTVCRHAERRIVKLDKKAKLDDEIIKYINRLSDYLFVLARSISYENGVEETIWKAE